MYNQTFIGLCIITRDISPYSEGRVTTSWLSSRLNSWQTASRSFDKYFRFQLKPFLLQVDVHFSRHQKHLWLWRQYWYVCMRGGKVLLFNFQLFAMILFKSMWSNSVLWQHKTESTLAEIMARFLAVPSHYLNWYWLISSAKASDVHLRIISLEIPEPSITKTAWDLLTPNCIQIKFPFVRQTHRLLVDSSRKCPRIDIFFIVGLNKLHNNQSSYLRFDTLWRSCDSCIGRWKSPF